MEARIGLAIFPLKMSFLDQGSKIVLTHNLHKDPHHTNTHTHTHTLALSLTTQASSRCIIKSFKVELSVFITRKEGVQYENPFLSSSLFTAM